MILDYAWWYAFVNRVSFSGSITVVNKILFLCTGNYYRSRYAEIVFNWHAEKLGLAWRADSRGLDPDPRNPGPISRHTLAALEKRGIPVEPEIRFPIEASAADFCTSQHIVAVKEAEHRPLVERNFREWLAQVEFWHVHDLDCCGPEEAIPHLDRELAALIARLNCQPTATCRAVTPILTTG
jgi:protein-tyrosine phosphatase